MMKLVFLYLIAALFACGLEAPDPARRGLVPASMSTPYAQAPQRVKEQWEVTQSFVKAWAAGDAQQLEKLMRRNIEIFDYINGQGNGNELLRTFVIDEQRERIIGKLLILRNAWRQYKLLHFWASIKPMIDDDNQTCTVFDIGTLDSGEHEAIKLTLYFIDGKVSGVFLSYIAYSYPQAFRKGSNIHEITGVQLDSATWDGKASPLPSLLSVGLGQASVSCVRYPEQTVKMPAEIAGIKVDPAAVGTWGGRDKDYGDELAVRRAAAQNAGVYNEACRIAAKYAALRQTGSGGNKELFADKILLLGQDKVVSREQFMEMIGKHYMVWPQGAWPIRGGAVGTLIDFITKFEAPGFTTPIVIKTSLIIENHRIRAIGESQYTGMRADHYGKLLPEADYEALAKDAD